MKDNAAGASSSRRLERAARLRVGVVALLAAMTGCGGERADRLPYPASRTVDVVDNYHGTMVADPYRWLEDLEAPEVKAWAAAQTALAVPFLRDNEIRPWLVARVAEHERFWADSSDSGADEPPLIDETTLGAGRSIPDIWRSPDGKLAAYTISEGGSEWVEGRIRRLADGKDLDDRLDDLIWPEARWTHDSRGFFYVRSTKPADGRAMSKGPALYYHTVGTPQSADIALFRTPVESTDLILETQLSDDGRYFFLYEGNGAHVDGIGWLLTRMHVLDLGDPKSPKLDNPIVPLSAARDAAYRVIATRGDTAYLLTDRDAPMRRIVAMSLGNPAPANWRDVVPESDGVIDLVYPVNDRFVVLYFRKMQHAVRVHERSGALVRELAIPPLTAVTDVRGASAPNELIVETMEGGLAPSRARHDLTTGRVVVERPAKVPFAAGTYEVKLEWYPSRDGVRIPMYVLRRRDIVLDGSHPTLLFGYGASSQLTLPWFGPWAVTALDAGLVIAFPALRGGGEFGRAWYEAATLERKQTTFDDFIAAAEYLIDAGYTSAERLGIQGGSNGGLLVAAVINQRPELFRAAVAEVPQTDALRYDRGRHAAQFGDPKNPAHFPFLRAYSPQHNIRPGTCYPATLITTAMNDDRAPAWMALKYTAALQAAQSCDRPIILRADTAGGHAGGDHASADAVAFVATQLGVQVPTMP